MSRSGPHGSQPSALRWMEGRKDAPKHGDPAELPGASMLWTFWMHCKYSKRCGRPPYDRLLINPVLRADYNNTTVARKGSVQAKTNQGEC